MRKVVTAAVVFLALAALVAAYGCNRASDPWLARGTADQGAWLGAGGLSGSPVIVSCGPSQRAVVRATDAMRGGVTEVECLAMAPAPFGWGASEAGWVTPRAVPAAMYPPAPVERRIVYERAPERTVRRGRTWQKSALIIGSSAGVGAGVGAAVGGKKGALIGAAIGGGGATIWDQATRR